MSDGKMSDGETLVKRYGWRYISLGFLYPITVLFTTPFRLLQALWSLRVLLGAKLSDYCRYDAVRSLNSSFHRSYYYYVQKNGRNGYAFDVSLGKKVSTIFQITTLSMYLYAKYEILVPLLGMLSMVFGYLVWLREDVDQNFIIAVAALGFISSTFYSLAFESIKYDALGWAAVPFGYYAIYTDNYYLLGACFFIVTMTSFSVTVVQGFVWFSVCAVFHDPISLAAFVPGALKILTHFTFMLNRGGAKNVENIASAVGFTSSAAKRYKLKLDSGGLYFLGIWGQFCIPLILLGEGIESRETKYNLFVLFLVCFLYFINKAVRRFGDEQTFYALSFCAILFITIRSGDLRFLPFVWIAISPIPKLLNFASEWGEKSLLLTVPRRKPYNIAPVRELSTKFIEPVKEYDRIFFDLKFNPDEFVNFGKASYIREYLNFLLLMRSASLLPDCYLMFDVLVGMFPLKMFYEDYSPAGRVKAMNDIGAKYILIATRTSDVGDDWKREGFEAVSVLDYHHLSKIGRISNLFVDPGKPYFLLLENKSHPSSIVGPGELVSISRNKMEVRLSENGDATIKYLYHQDWSGGPSVKVSKLDGSFFWIRVEGAPGETVTLRFGNL
ncbi:MAG: hypothetical protein NUW37_20035 [Planctomycetes bacterium]|nr:hypothetical protein [Planctomycetota bacterium]